MPTPLYRQIKPAELIFAIVMLVIIMFSFGDYYQEMRPYAQDVEHKEIIRPEQSKELAPQSEADILEVHGELTVSVFILLLLVISYCALGASMYLMRDVRR